MCLSFSTSLPALRTSPQRAGQERTGGWEALSEAAMSTRGAAAKPSPPRPTLRGAREKSSKLRLLFHAKGSFCCRVLSTHHIHSVLPTAQACWGKDCAKSTGSLLQALLGSTGTRGGHKTGSTARGQEGLSHLSVLCALHGRRTVTQPQAETLVEQTRARICLLLRRWQPGSAHSRSPAAICGNGTSSGEPSPPGAFAESREAANSLLVNVLAF